MTNEIDLLVKQTIQEVKDELQTEIEKFWQEHLDIMKQDIPLEDKLKQIKELIKEYREIQDDETLREAQKNHKNNDAPLSRNRLIIKAELEQHLMNYDDNWDHNQNHAGGKYTSKKKEEWLQKKSKLEAELKDSVN